MRLDGDMHQSTTDALAHLSPKLSPGGCVIVDGDGHRAAGRQAVHDGRAAHAIGEEIRRAGRGGARRPVTTGAATRPVRAGAP
jgi:hypothetical protein